MIVSTQLFEAYIECSTKCWLRSRAEPTAGNVYAEWVRGQNETYRQDGLKLLLASFPESDCAIGPPISREFQGRNLAHCYRRALADERSGISPASH